MNDPCWRCRGSDLGAGIKYDHDGVPQHRLVSDCINTLHNRSEAAEERAARSHAEAKHTEVTATLLETLAAWAEDTLIAKEALSVGLAECEYLRGRLDRLGQIVDTVERQRAHTERRLDLVSKEWLRMKDERDKALAIVRLVRMDVDDCWRWQGDGEDHHESLSCPVIMDSRTLRSILEERDTLRTDLARCQKELSQATIDLDLMVQSNLTLRAGLSEK